MKDYCGLPFVTVPNERRTGMTIGQVIEELIQIKKDNDIRYPYDEAMNNACNILSKLPRQEDVYDWINNNTK
jgi:hypothetical protein